MATLQFLYEKAFLLSQASKDGSFFDSSVLFHLPYCLKILFPLLHFHLDRAEAKCFSYISQMIIPNIKKSYYDQFFFIKECEPFSILFCFIFPYSFSFSFGLLFHLCILCHFLISSATSRCFCLSSLIYGWSPSKILRLAFLPCPFNIPL